MFTSVFINRNTAKKNDTCHAMVHIIFLCLYTLFIYCESLEQLKRMALAMPWFISYFFVYMLSSFIVSLLNNAAVVDVANDFIQS
jgi:hypothetical protein